MYKVENCQYPRRNGEFLDGWVVENISDDNQYPFWVNKYLHQVAQGSVQTAKQYAYKLCAFMNYLDSVWGISYREANVAHLHKFTRYLQYGNVLPLGISEGNKSGFTIRGYLGVIKSFYIFLHQNDLSLNMKVVTTAKENPHSYLYGQNWEQVVSRLEIDDVFDRSKPQVQYEKWYTDEQIKAIMSNFNTYRDKAIFSLSLDGLRIDEILSSKMKDYDSMEGIITTYRSKGRKTGETNRICVLSQRSVNMIEEYLFNERAIVEEDFLNDGKILTGDIFINLKKHSNTYGITVKYHNILEIIKSAAARAGMDPTKIRTHSGRSTRAAELFKYQSEHPTELSDNQIKDMMGWKNLDSAEPYKNKQDRETMLNTAKRLRKIKEDRADEGTNSSG